MTQNDTFSQEQWRSGLPVRYIPGWLTSGVDIVSNTIPLPVDVPSAEILNLLIYKYEYRLQKSSRKDVSLIRVRKLPGHATNTSVKEGIWYTAVSVVCHNLGGCALTTLFVKYSGNSVDYLLQRRDLFWLHHIALAMFLLSVPLAIYVRNFWVFVCLFSGSIMIGTFKDVFQSRYLTESRRLDPFVYDCLMESVDAVEDHLQGEPRVQNREGPMTW